LKGGAQEILGTGQDVANNITKDIQKKVNNYQDD